MNWTGLNQKLSTIYPELQKYAVGLPGGLSLDPAGASTNVGRYTPRGFGSVNDSSNVYWYKDDPSNRSIRMLENPTIQSTLQAVNKYSLVDPQNRWTNTGVAAAIGGLVGLLASIGVKEKPEAALVETQNGNVVARKKTIGIKEQVYKRVIAGLTIGALTGYFGPKIIQRTAGRIITNLWQPQEYDMASHLNLIRDLGKDDKGDFSKWRMLKGMFRAVEQDKPIYDKYVYGPFGNKQPFDNPNDPGRKESIYGRAALLRGSFGLTPNLPFNAYSTHVNPATGVMEAEINLETPEGRKGALYNLSHYNEAKKDIAEGATYNPMARRLPDGGIQFRGEQGTLKVKPDRTFTYPWKYDIKSEEKITSMSDILRALSAPFVSPVKVSGRIPTDEEGALYRELENPKAAVAARQETKSDNSFLRSMLESKSAELDQAKSRLDLLNPPQGYDTGL
jgi:hypothetical protein